MMLGVFLSGCGDESVQPPAAGRQRRGTHDPIAQFEPGATPSPRPPTETVTPDTRDITLSSPLPQPKEAPFAPPPESIEADEGTSFFLVLETPPDQDAPQPPEGATLQDLIEERAALRRELQKIDQEAADIARIPLAPEPASETPTAGQRFAGTMRDLNLSNAPAADAQIVMRKRGMRMTQSLVSPGVSQDFLSGATGADGQRFTARPSLRTELVNALVLSPRTIEYMARLERQEIQKRGLNPARTYVRRIVFGVVGSGENADLGILQLDAVPVSNSGGRE